MRIIANLSLIACIAFVSCTEIYFERPQPKGVKPLKEGIRELVGEYISAEDDDDKDTISVTLDKIVFNDDDLDESLGDIMVIKRYKGYYFLNFHSEEKDLWQLIVVKDVKEDLLEITNLTSIDQDNARELEEKRYSEVRTNDDDDYIVMDPPRRRLMQMIEYPIFDENKLVLNKIKSN